MNWEIEVADEFKGWYETLSEDEQESVSFGALLLADKGPSLGRPYVDTVYGSRFTNMKELRVQHEGRPYRIFFAFDPRRMAYFILGGDKTGDNLFYERMIPKSDEIYAKHLREIGEQ